MPRAAGAATKDAIIEAATVEFRRHGYRNASLGDVASTLGITRAAVHFHVHTKAELLEEVLAPLLGDCETLLAAYDPAVTLNARQRRVLLGKLVDIEMAHADAAGIISGDVTCRSEDKVRARIDAVVEGLTVLLTERDPSAIDHLAVSGILGAIARSVTSPWADPKDPATRTVILRMATALAGHVGRAA